jgi:hypothetical protein
LIFSGDLKNISFHLVAKEFTLAKQHSPADRSIHICLRYARSISDALSKVRAAPTCHQGAAESAGAMLKAVCSSHMTGDDITKMQTEAAIYASAAAGQIPTAAMLQAEEFAKCRRKGKKTHSEGRR